MMTAIRQESNIKKGIYDKDKTLTMKHLQNYHLLTLKFLPPTNYRVARVKITSPRFKVYVTIPRDYELGMSLVDQAVPYLTGLGYELIGQTETIDGSALLSTTFKPLKKQNKV